MLAVLSPWPGGWRGGCPEDGLQSQAPCCRKTALAVETPSADGSRSEECAG